MMLIWIIFLFFLIFDVKGNPDACITTNYINGKCMSLFDCPLYARYEHHLENPEIKGFLSRNICGRGEGNSWVKFCCPHSSILSRVNTVLSPDENLISDVVSKMPLFSECGAYDSRLRIVGGKPSKYGKWPWMAALGMPRGAKFDMVCGGIIISHYFILSAAHCFHTNETMLNPTHARLADYDLTTNNDRAKAVDFLLRTAYFNNFQRESFENDIVLLKVDRYIEFTDFIKPACLPIAVPGHEYEGDEIVITGWGFTKSDAGASPIPLEARTPILKLKTCKKAYKRSGFSVDDRNLCSGSNGVDSCTGDSGGPINYMNPNTGKWTVIGLTSFGIGCANPNYPGVSTNIAKFLPWIVTTVEDNS